MLFPYLPFLVEFLILRLREDEKDVGKICSLSAVPAQEVKIFHVQRRKGSSITTTH